MILPKLLRLLFASERIMTQLDTISMTETIKKYGHGKMKLILEIFSRSITTVNNLDRISTGEMFRAQKNLYKGSRPVGYPRGGFRNITQQLAEYIIENGGEIHLGKPVNKIIMKNNKATGIFIGDEEHNFDVIISDILVQDLFKLTNESDFPKEYVKNLKSLTGTSSLCAFYSLKKVNPLFIGKTFHFIERNVGVDGNDAVGMIDMMTAMNDSGLTSNSDRIVQSYIICATNETKNKETLEKLKKLLDKNLETLIPDFREQLNWSIYPLVWHLDGVAKTIDNIKPDIKTPIQNLYLVGDCVKAPGIGINCAVASAVQLASII